MRHSEAGFRPKNLLWVPTSLFKRTHSRFLIAPHQRDPSE